MIQVRNPPPQASFLFLFLPPSSAERKNSFFLEDVNTLALFFSAKNNDAFFLPNSFQPAAKPAGLGMIPVVAVAAAVAAVAAAAAIAIARP